MLASIQFPLWSRFYSAIYNQANVDTLDDCLDDTDNYNDQLCDALIESLQRAAIAQFVGGFSFELILQLHFFIAKRVPIVVIIFWGALMFASGLASCLLLIGIDGLDKQTALIVFLTLNFVWNIFGFYSACHPRNFEDDDQRFSALLIFVSLVVEALLTAGFIYFLRW